MLKFSFIHTVCTRDKNRKLKQIKHPDNDILPIENSVVFDKNGIYM